MPALSSWISPFSVARRVRLETARGCSPLSSKKMLLTRWRRTSLCWAMESWKSCITLSRPLKGPIRSPPAMRMLSTAEAAKQDSSMGRSRSS